MTNTGHNERTQAVLDNLTRRATHTREVRAEHLPPDIRQALVTIMERILALEEGHKASAELQTTTAQGLLQLRQDLANVKTVMGKVGEEAERKLGRVA